MNSQSAHSLSPSLRGQLAAAEKAFRALRFPEAARICAEILAVEDTQPDALNIMALIAIEQRRPQDALAYLQKAVSAYPERAGLHGNIGKLLLDMTRLLESAEAFRRALEIQPDNQKFMVGFTQAMRSFEFKAFAAPYKKTITDCLKNPYLTHRFLTLGWSSLYQHDAAFSYVRELQDNPALAPDISRLQEPLNDTFLCEGIKALLIQKPSFDILFTRLRRLMLEQPAAILDKFLPFLYALSQGCFFSEYVFAESPDEATEIEKLQALPAPSKAQIALLACYRPLHATRQAAFAKSLASAGMDADFSALVKLQVDEPGEETRIRADIKSLTPISDDISRAVQAQYEENPYPRWLHVGVLDMPEPAKIQARGRKILVAGCGTGSEAADVSAHFPYADITAIDLSRSSLAYAIRKTRELQMNNIRFLHADILELDRLEEQFDLVISSGVLHHMKDPAAGLSSLVRRLKPRGLIKIALYSTKARRHYKTLQDMIKNLKIPPTAEGIRSFRQMIFALPDSDPLKQAANIRDFYSLSTCRDLVFHVQEHTYTLPQLKDLVESCGLAMQRMGLQSPLHRLAYLKEFPDDPAMLNVQNWDQFEDRHPETFISMFNVWMTRKEDISQMDDAWIKAAMKGA